MLTRASPTCQTTISIHDQNPTSTSAWRKTAIIATAKSITNLENLKSILKTSNTTTSMKTIYVGGLTILLAFNSSVLATTFLQDNNKFLKEWFSHFAIWDGEDTNYGRIAKVRILGVPMPLWDQNIFNKIGATAGKVLEPSLASFNDGNLSHERLTILVKSCTRIDHLVSLKWKTKSYLTRIVEDNDIWSPSFLDNTDSSENSGDSVGNLNDKSQPTVNSSNPHWEHTNIDTINQVSCAPPPIPNGNPGKPFGNPTQNNFQTPNKQTNHFFPWDHTQTAPLYNKQSPPPCTSRKRPRKSSPIPQYPHPMHIDLNSPPDTQNPSNKASLSKSEYLTRLPPNPIPFQNLFTNDEQPPHNDQNLSQDTNPQNPFPPHTTDHQSSPNDISQPNNDHNPHSQQLHNLENQLENTINLSESPPPLISDEASKTKEVGACIGINLDGFEKELQDLVDSHRAQNLHQ
ncbi:nucleotide-binding alpha-beta plait domain-containing protein [Artemisia annua]|uniref:Nucleotide-binding alpha-beta plait domain-containing protein n=1 Tax=Artemisia annua TaxID=35608 RepID=A0A2U1KW39_ARTAN|nr:nucleotide-binding alpha-beta plait domain-containing protein [Artemisia annua]